MIIKQTEDNRKEWLENLKMGDEVCVTNTYKCCTSFLDTNVLFGSLNSIPNETHKEEICIISTVRGILDDGSIVIGGNVYTPEGKMVNNNSSYNVELHQPVKDLRELALKLQFSSDIKKIEWKRFSEECIRSIIGIINEEIEIIEKENCKPNE